MSHHCAEEKYRRLFENAVTGIFQTTVDGQYLSVNASLAAIYGYESPEAMMAALLNIQEQLYVNPQRRQEFVTLMKETGAVVEFESQVYRRDGQVVWIAEQAIAVRDADGQFLYYEGTVEDITRRKEAEQTMCRQLTAIEASGTGIGILNAAGEFIYMNRVHAEVYGYEDPAALIGKSWTLLYDAQQLQRFQTEVMPQFAQQGSWSGEAEGLRQDGSTFPQQVSLTALDDGGLVYIVQDITQRRLANQALREREERFRSLLSNISGAVYRCAFDEDWTMEFISDPVEQITGYPASAFINNHDLTYASIIVLEDSDYVTEEITRALDENRSYSLEYRIRHADGNIRWLYEKGRGILDEQGQVICLDGVIFDISDRRRQEERLRLLESVVVNTGDAVMITEIASDPSLRLQIAYVNAAFTRMTGYTLEDVMGRSPNFLLGENTSPTEIFRIQSALTRLQPLQAEMVGYRKDGSEFWMEFEMIPVADDAYTHTHWISVQRDISDRKQAEEALRNSKEAAEDANRAKSQFLANMSHELRTPLNAIIGYSEMLQEDADDLGYSNIVPDLEKIRGAGKHLLSLINDILDISKIEAGKMEVYLETFEVSQLVYEVQATIQPAMDKNHNSFVIECSPDVGMVHADLTKVRQSLLNLLSNAAKFTERGTITLTVLPSTAYPHALLSPSSLPLSHSPAYIGFRVSDTGIGMTEAQMQKVFQAFSQADASTTRKYGGTGLGLAISRRFCQMMGGDITVTSEAGQGSIFTIWLPMNVADTQRDLEQMTQGHGSAVQYQESRQAIAHGSTVLVIDDDPAVRDLMQRYLMREGFHVETAADGEEGLQLARELRPDAITLDVLMPTMNGWSVLSAFKTDPELADIPVVVMTIVDDKNKGFALGAADYLTKPVDYRRLTTLLRQYRPATSNTLDRAGQVLLVEDDPTIRVMFRRMLEREGWAVAEAENGRVGLEQVAVATPDLILLDLMMPEMDGFQFIAALRHNPDWRSLPIVVVTALNLTPADHLHLNGYVEQILQKDAHSCDDLLREVHDLVLTCIRHRRAKTGEAQ